MITSRNFTDDEYANHKKLALLELKHDFKSFSTDRIVKKRHTNEFDYLHSCKLNTYRRAMELDPTYSYFFNGCDRGYHTPEAFGLEQARIQTKNEGIRLVYPEKDIGTERDVFYKKLSTILESYRQDDKIPLIIDTDKSLSYDSTYPHAKIELTNNFVICKNKEYYADPAPKTSSYGTGIGKIDINEIGDNERFYINEELFSGMGSIIITGSIDDQRIQYGQSGWSERFKRETIKANTIAACKKKYDTLSKGLNMNGKFDKNFCILFQNGEDLDGDGGVGSKDGKYPGVTYPDDTKCMQLGAQFLKKRCGDQLQVLSCIQRINYRINNDRTSSYGGFYTPCVFWSIDQLAIAFAILHGIPCVHQQPNKHVTIYLPPKQGTQYGGLRSREAVNKLRNIQSEDIGNSWKEIELINSDPVYLKAYIQLLLTYNEPGFDTINLLKILKFGSRANWPGYTQFDSILHPTFTDTLTSNIHGQICNTHGLPRGLNIDTIHENYILYTNTLNIYYENVYPNIEYRVRTTIGIGQPDLTLTQNVLNEQETSIFNQFLNMELEYVNTEESAREAGYTRVEYVGYGRIMANLGLSLLSILVGIYIVSHKEPSQQGGGNKTDDFIKLYQELTVIKTTNTLDTDFQQEYYRFGSLFMYEFLEAMANTESKFILFPELGEAFMSLDSSEIPIGGYTSYELIFFIKYLCETRDPEICSIFAFLPNFLRDLEFMYLLNEIESYMSRVEKYTHFFNDKAYTLLPQEFKTTSLSMLRELLDKVKVDVDKTNTELSRLQFNEEKIYEYLDTHCPHGYITRHVLDTRPVLEKYINHTPSARIAKAYSSKGSNLAKYTTGSNKVNNRVNGAQVNKSPKLGLAYGGKRSKKTKKRKNRKNRTYRRSCL